jgi:DNA-binding NarL/FixJ family response regulator
MSRVLVVDDHALLRKGIQTILGAWPEWQVVGEAGNGQEAVQLTKELLPDIVLMDISMPGMGGLEATRVIRRASPDTKVLLLTLHNSIELVETALRAGARGYLLKSDSEGELVRALRVVAENGVYISPGLEMDQVRRIVTAQGLASPVDRASTEK